MPCFTDQLNRTIELASPPKRIISLVPSQTELLYDLGLDEEVVGITKFCIHPQKWFREKARIGGTKTVDTAKISALRPDLIIANKEENRQEQVEELAAVFPVWISDVNNLPEAYLMIESIGDITGKQAVAQNLIEKIQRGFAQLRLPAKSLRTAYLIWKEPYMTVGSDTFIHDLVKATGFENVFAARKRYPVISIEELKAAHCELLLLSSEPYPFKQKHISEWQQHLPSTVVMLVDGELFSWYGSRLLQVPAYFQSLQEKIRSIV